jgi:methylthioxylose transferase
VAVAVSRSESVVRVRAHSDGAARTVLALSAFGALLCVSFLLLGAFDAADRDWLIDAPPLKADFGSAMSPRLAIPVIVAAALIVGWRLALVLSWTRLLVAAAIGSAVWAVALAVVDGADGLTDPIVAGEEYIHDVDAVGTPGAFLGDFTDRIEEYTAHVQGHPPGLLLGLWSLDRIGLGEPGWAAALFVAGGAAAVAAVLVTAREVAGELWARRAVPFLVMAPAAIWVASSADAFYAGVGAWAVALVVLATRSRPAADALALTGGLLFGLLCFLSYGLVLLAAIPLVVAVDRATLRPIALAVVGAVPVFGIFAAAGFWWVDGLLATKDRYFAGVAGDRPYLTFLIANLAAFAIVVGPAAAVALARLRARGMWLLAGGALGAIAIADLSGMSKGEVERIWLPFAPWVLLAGAALVGRSAGSTVGWLAAQAGAAIFLATWVRIPW